MNQKRKRNILLAGAAAVVLAAFSIFGAAILLPTQGSPLPTAEESQLEESSMDTPNFPRIPQPVSDPLGSGSSREESGTASQPESEPDREVKSIPEKPPPSSAAPSSSREEAPKSRKPASTPSSEPAPAPAPAPEATPDPGPGEIVLETEALTLTVGESAKIRIASAPARVLSYGANWVVDNKLVADFVTARRDSVTIEAKHKGKTIVTVTSKDGTLSASCLVTVLST